MTPAVNQRIALGTAQFGLSCGISNLKGQVELRETEKILDCATSHGIDTLDTAIAYGNSEHRLGEVGVAKWKVISKLPSIPAECADVAGWFDESIAGSLRRLRLRKLHGLLLHRPNNLLGTHGAELFDALQRARDSGLVEKIGISIYEPEELASLVPRFHFDIVQAPLNILDRRLVDSGWLSRLAADGTEVHARSVFLQGLLLMSTMDRLRKFDRWSELWTQWERWLSTNNLTALRACLGYPLSFPEITAVVVGVESTAQLNDIALATQTIVSDFPKELQSNDLHLINPIHWAELV